MLTGGSTFNLRHSVFGYRTIYTIVLYPTFFPNLIEYLMDAHLMLPIVNYSYLDKLAPVFWDSEDWMANINIKEHFLAYDKMCYSFRWILLHDK